MTGFPQTIQRVIQQLDRGCLIDDQLRSVSRWSFRWAVTLLCCPFYRLLGIDPFSFIRIDRVAQKLLEECAQHRETLSKEILDDINRHIFERLNRKTGMRYQLATAQAWAGIQQQFYEPIPIPSKEEIEWRWPLDCTSAPVPDADQKAIIDFATSQLSRLPVIRPDIAPQFNLYYLYDQRERIAAVFVSLGERAVVVGRGAQREVRTCADLRRGKVVVEKEVSRYEAVLMKVLSQKKGDGFRGIGKVLGTFVLSPTPSLKRFVVIEKKYNGSLDSLLGEELLGEFSRQIEVIDQLLSYMMAFYLTDPSLGQSQYRALAGFPPFHGDLKPQNILFESGKRLKVAVTDFGGSNWFPAFIISVYYASPETIEHFMNRNKQKETSAFNQKFGQARDVWAMGIIFAQLLSNSKTPPETIMKAFSLKKPAPDKMLLSGWVVVPEDEAHRRETLVRATTVDDRPKIHYDPIDWGKLHEEILGMKAKVSGPHQFILRKIWDLVLEMLAVNPKERISIPALREKWLTIGKMTAC